jgi:hypothetical protein
MKPNTPKKFNYLYRIVCTPTGQYYHGIHSTDQLADSYMGTGKRMRASLQEHGRAAHVKTIVSHFETREEASEAERALVTRAMLADPLCLNLQTGGDNNVCFSQETLLKLKKNDDQKAAISARRAGKATLITEEQRAAHALKVSGAGNGMFGKTRPAEWRARHGATMSALMKGRDLGKPNLNTKGRSWWSDPATGATKMLREPLPGWVRGRV